MTNRKQRAVLRYIAFRLLRMVGTLWALVTLVYFALQLAPGSPVDTLVNAGANPDVIASMKRDLGLDRPLWEQYIGYLIDLLRGDFGVSWRNGTPVAELMASAFVHTALLASVALLVALVLGVGVGVLAALYRDNWFDVTARVAALIGISVPIFIINLAGIYIFAFKYPIFPTSGSGSWDSLVLPAVTLGLFVAAMMLRLVRSSTLDVLSQDYVTAARSRGVPGRRVVGGHVLPNIMVILVTLLGTQFGLLLGGSVITESVFAWPGLGGMTITAIKTKDIPVVQGAVTVFAAAFLMLNFLVDSLYPLLDPRIRLER